MTEQKPLTMNELRKLAEQASMSPFRFRTCLAAIGWTSRHLAHELGMNERQIRRWAAGSPIPIAVAHWLEKLAKFHEAHPAPARPTVPGFVQPDTSNMMDEAP